MSQVNSMNVVIDSDKTVDTIEINPGYSQGVYNLLITWLRTFWRKLYRDKSFINTLCGSRAERVSQLYLNVFEGIQLLNHTEAPVFHRESWYPIIVRKNERNRAKHEIVKLGDAGVKLSESELPDFNEKLKLGTFSDRKDTVAYPVSPDVVSVLSCIVDNIADPSVILKNGSDFTVEENSIVLMKKYDPFIENSMFAVFDVPATPTSEQTEEAVLWACDTLIDNDYVYKFSGCAIGLKDTTSTVYAEIVKNVWDATTDGLSPTHMRQVLAALCCVPSVLSDSEKIETVFCTSESKQVITDKKVYTLGSGAQLLDCVKAGNVLHKGDLLDSSVRIYPFPVFVENMEGYSGFSTEQFMKDVTSMSIPSALISGDDVPGFYVGWDPVDVTCHGFDSNGNPKLRFDLSSGTDTEDEYWEGVWKSFESAGKSMVDCFEGLKSDNIYENGVCGTVVPIRFFLRNLVGANTIVIFIDTDAIPDSAPLYNPSFFNALRKLIPAQIRLYFVEHGSAVDDEFCFEDSSDQEYKLTAGVAYTDDDFDDIEDSVLGTKLNKVCSYRKRKHEDSDDDYDY